MNVRPKFWIHRSGRFWWGLLILVTILAGWFLTVFSESEILREVSAPSGGFSESRFSINNGGIGVSWNDGSLVGGTTSRSPARWKVSFHESRRGLKLAPEWDWSDTTYPAAKGSGRPSSRFRQLTVFFPLWIPLLGWVILWPLRMHRADKAEDARLRGQGYLEPEA